MSLPKIDEIKNLDKNELENEILNIKKQLFKLRLRRGAKQSFNSHQFKHGKHSLAQLLMIQKSN